MKRVNCKFPVKSILPVARVDGARTLLLGKLGFGTQLARASRTKRGGGA